MCRDVADTRQLEGASLFEGSRDGCDAAALVGPPVDGAVALAGVFSYVFRPGDIRRIELDTLG